MSEGPDGEDEFADEDAITLIGTNWTVSATEKVSTGQYENYQPHVTVKGQIPMVEIDDETRPALKQKLLTLHGDLQDVLTKAGGNRNAEPEWESWEFGDEGPEVKTVEEHEEEKGETDD